MQLRLIQRLINYETLLQQVIVYLTNGGFVTGTLAKVHRDFITVMTVPNGAIDIPFSSIVAVSPVNKKSRKGKG
ncbi:hypothetical protein [Tepidibacillus marianensis]|uniref:hypothetical protein n=1 Tax=Tepidibacillus marianensis TaxID=3131995 RepID=UPI0030CF062B